MDKAAGRKVRVLASETLHKRFVHLSKVTVEHDTLSGGTQIVDREIHDHGNAATILLVDPGRHVTVLVRQLRLPVHLNGEDGWLIETPAGLLDGDHPDVAICREAMEETGYRVEGARHLFDAYMSPGAVTERVSFYVAEIDLATRAEAGGGLAEEGEDIEVLVVALKDAWGMIADGRIKDGKTIMLLQWAMMHYPERSGI